jgi:hypothetical protein
VSGGPHVLFSVDWVSGGPGCPLSRNHQEENCNGG